MAEKAVRVNTKDKPVDNEKFAMRTFLNRIGLSGMEYKPLRKELMRNLSGDGAFRYGRPERWVRKINTNSIHSRNVHKLQCILLCTNRIDIISV